MNVALIILALVGGTIMIVLGIEIVSLRREMNQYIKYRLMEQKSK